MQTAMAGTSLLRHFNVAGLLLAPSLYPDQYSSNQLSLLIMAEDAWHRGDDKDGAFYYLQVVKQTPDINLIKRGLHMAISGEHYHLATELAGIWASEFPNDQDAQRIAASLYLVNGEQKQAIPYIFSFIEHCDKDKVSQLAHFLPYTDKTTKLALLNKFTQAKQTQNIRYGMALINYYLENYQESDLLIEQALKKEPNWLEALSLKTQLLLKTGHQQTALNMLQKKVQQLPNKPYIRLLYAEALAETSHHKKARSEYLKLQKYPSTRNLALLNLAKIALVKNEFANAKTYLEKIDKSTAEGNTAYYILGQIAEQELKPEQALTNYGNVYAGPFYLLARERMITIYIHKGKIKTAIKILRESEPESMGQYRSLTLRSSQLLLSNNYPSDALDILTAALREWPNDIHLLYARSAVAQKLEKYHLLERDLKRIVNIDANQTRALQSLGVYLADNTDRYQEAYGYLNRALILEPNNPTILDSMGWLQYRIGNLDKALDYLQQAYKLQPSGHIAAHLGEVLWLKGQHQQAQDIWHEALENSPHNSEAKLTIRNLLRKYPQP